VTAVPPLSTRFKLLRRLGEGGMGTVYEAVDGDREERVALKLLRHTTPDALVRFKREFRSLQDLHHENLVTLGELVSEGNQWFFTMELVKGEDFVSWVTTVPSLRPVDAGAGMGKTAPAAPFGFDERRLRSSLVQLVRGLSVLHDAQKVHRDVKPSNVLVTADGRVVILDFGLVHDLAPDAGPTMTDLDVVGTPAYMAPEQAASQAVGPAADWYAVGVLLYEALTGELPFSGAPLEVLLRKQKDEPRPPSSLVAGLPSDLDDLCARLLRFDPAQRPSAHKILGVLDAAPRGGAGSMPSLSSISLGVPFVGRESEVVELQKAYADARAGGAVSVLVHGESGIGKSCLVRHFVDATASQERELVVLQGRCYEREAVPYKALDGVVDTLARFLGRLPAAEAAHFVPTRPGPLVQVFPVLRRVEVVAQGRSTEEPIADPLELRARAFGAMRELLVRLADRRPLIVVIDDLQWADGDSIALLQEILRPPEEPALLLVATVRDQGSDAITTTTMILSKLPEPPALLLPGDVRRIDLGRLGRVDARALVGRLVERLAPGMAFPAAGSSRSPIDAETLAREADGHPLFIDEMVRHLFLVGASRGALRLEDALWSRIASLEEVPRRIVETVAVAGSPLPQDAVCKAVEANVSEFQRLVSFLRVAHLVRTTGTRGHDAIECFHGRIRDAVLGNIDGATRRRHHWRIAVALEASPNADVDQLAVHWLGAGDVDNAAKHMLAAADRATSALAFERAAGLYERALQLRLRSTRKMPRAEERALQVKLGDALSNAGRGALAARAYRAAAVGANATEALDLERRAAHQLLRSGHFDEGLTAIQDVLASVGRRMPTAPWAALLALLFWRVVLAVRGFRYRLRDASEVSARDLTRIDVCYAVASSLSLVDPIRGQLFQQRNILLSLRLGEPNRVARALATEVSYRGLAGGPGWKRTHAVDLESQRLAAQVGDPQGIAWSIATSAVAHYLAGFFEEGLKRCEQSEKIFTEQCAGAVWEAFTMRLFGLQCLLHLGRLRELASRQPSALRHAIERGDLYAATNLRIGYPNMAWLVEDDPARARREAKEAMRQWSKGGFHLEHYYELLALTNADLYDGDARAAHERVVARWPALRRALIMRVQMVRMMAWHMRARAAIARAVRESAGRRDLLREAARDAVAIAREQMPWGRAMATTLSAGIARLEGDSAAAAAHLESAAREADGCQLAFVAIAARHALGVCRGGAEGARLVEAAEAAAAAEGIKAPKKLIAMMVPGFE
jgi:hypothetical protein